MLRQKDLVERAVHAMPSFRSMAASNEWLLVGAYCRLSGERIKLMDSVRGKHHDPIDDVVYKWVCLPEVKVDSSDVSLTTVTTYGKEEV